MSSSDHLSTGQLRMFIPAKELVEGKLIPYEERAELGGEWIVEPVHEQKWSRDETDAEFWDRKVDEAVTTGLYDEIEDRGVETPVALTHTVEEGDILMDGKHRVAVSHDLDPDTEIPVVLKERWEPHDYGAPIPL